MPTSNALPANFPDGTKYVVEGRGDQVHRHIEYPDGRRVELPPRKALTCTCVEARKSAGKASARRARKLAGKPARKAA